MTKFVARYWGVGVIIIGALIWLRLHDNQVRELALSNARRDSLKAAYSVLEDLNKFNLVLKDSLERRDSIIEVEKSKLRARSAQLKQAQNATDSALSLVELSVSDRKLLDSTITKERLEAASEIHRLNSLVVLQEEQIVNYSSLIQNLQIEVDSARSLNVGLMKEVERLNKRKGISSEVKLVALAGAFLLGRAL